MKFNDKEHTIYSCGYKLTKTKDWNGCMWCLGSTHWVTSSGEYFCSEECLKREIKDTLGIDCEELDK